MKKIIVACGNGVATSQMVAYKVNKMLRNRHITDVYVEAVDIRSLRRHLQDTIAYIEIMHNEQDLGVPKIDGMAFLTGKNLKREFKYFLKIIKNSQEEK